MPFGLVISFLCHAALIGWAYLSMAKVQQHNIDDTPAISVEVVTPSEFLRLKEGAEDSKNLETKAKEEPKPDESKNDTKKPEASAPAPPPPPQEVAKAEPPPPPEPPKVTEPAPPPEPAKAEEPPPPPEPAPGPTPDEQKLLEQKIEEDRKKAEEAAKKKAEEEAKKKAEELKKKKAEEEKKKKLAEAKKKAEEAKKKFDPNAIANLLEKAPDDAKSKALLDKDPTKKGQQASGTSKTATATGKEAGVKGGKDIVLSAREADLLKGMIKSQLEPCTRMFGGGLDTPVVTVEWTVNEDGTVNGEPVVVDPQSSAVFQIAANASVNAVKNCPLSLPADKYQAWRQIRWEFDWPKMLGLR